MKKLNCLILDDEPSAIKLIEGYVNKTPFLELKGKCSNAVEAMKMVDNHKIDLLFIDIQMDDLNSINFSIIEKMGARVIFTTAFQEFAFIGFRAKALDFLLNPIRYKEFLKTANKARIWFEQKANQETGIEKNS